MRLVFMGTPESAVPTLRRCLEDGHEVVAVWTQPDRPAGRGYGVKEPPIKEFALAHGLEVEQPQKIKIDQARDLFESYDADAAIVVAYGRILPSSFLHAPRRGCINVHFSLLPKYRGAAPVNWAIARGERETGVTTMRIDEGLDTGAIYLQRSTEIGDEETAPELLARLADTGAQLLSETLARIDEIEPRPQRDEEATHAPILKREDGLIDWSMSAVEIERRVRGFQPWPNAYTIFRSQRLTLRGARPVGTFTRQDDDARRTESQTRGGIVAAHGDDLIVACGAASALRLLEVQPEGKRRMSARDFVNGLRPRIGESLG
jgi:methionyl-tRNA formyltransferase